MAQKFNSLQAARGVAALSVLLFHSQQVSRQLHPDTWVGRDFAFGAAGVDFFFVLSGFLMMYVHFNDLGRPWRIGSYLYKRFTRIFPIYWVLCAVLVPLMLLLPSIMQTQGKLALGNLAASVLLIPHQGAHLIGVTWSLEYEVVFYALFLLFLVSRRLGWTIFAVWGAAIAAANLLTPGAPLQREMPALSPFLARFLLSPHCLEFLGGVVVGWLLRRGFRTRFPKAPLIAGLLIAAATAVFDVRWNLAYSAPRARLLVYGMASILILAGCALNEMGRELEVPGWLGLVGAASYAIYLTHFPVLAVVRSVFARARFLSAVPAEVLLLVMVVVACIPGILLHLLVEKPLLRRMQGRHTNIGAAAPEHVRSEQQVA